jgi:hypothetical protein
METSRVKMRRGVSDFMIDEFLIDQPNIPLPTGKVNPPKTGE